MSSEVVSNEVQPQVSAPQMCVTILECISNRDDINNNGEVIIHRAADKYLKDGKVNPHHGAMSIVLFGGSLSSQLKGGEITPEIATSAYRQYVDIITANTDKDDLDIIQERVKNYQPTRLATLEHK